MLDEDDIGFNLGEELIVNDGKKKLIINDGKALMVDKLIIDNG